MTLPVQWASRLSGPGIRFYGMGPYVGQGVLDDLGIDVEGLSEDIAELMGELPTDLLGRHQAEYDRCRNLIDRGDAVSLIQGGRCLRDLYRDVRASLDEAKARPPGTTRPPAPSGFPWLIVGGAVAAAGLAGLYFLTRK